MSNISGVAINSTAVATVQNDDFGDLIYIMAVMLFYLVVMAALLLSRFSDKTEEVSKTADFPDGPPRFHPSLSIKNENLRWKRKMTSLAMQAAAHQTIGLIAGLTIDCRSQARPMAPLPISNEPSTSEADVSDCSPYNSVV